MNDFIDFEALMNRSHWAMIKDNIVKSIVYYDEPNEHLEKYYTFIELPTGYDVRSGDAYNPETGLFEHRDAVVPETTVVVFE
jgi:hypothetical protein